MKLIRYIKIGVIGAVIPIMGLLSMASCDKSEELTESQEQYVAEDVPEVYKKIYGASDIYLDGSYVVIKTNGVPDHNSPYFYGTQWGDKYESYSGNGFHQNPNSIGPQSLIFRIPLNPTEASNKSSTPMGPMGISLNGVPFFNQYAAGRTTLDNEIVSFDQYNGHPAGNNMYHYHIEPVYLTAANGKDQLLGFLLDGFPVYGPMEDGKQVSNNDLDAYHGHTHATSDYPDGIYHYHITDAAPYLNGDGFFGTVGTVAQ